VVSVRGGGDVRPSSRHRHLPQLAIGVVLGILLISAFTLVGVEHTRHTQGTPTRTTAQPSSTKAPGSASSFAIPGCYSPAVQPAARPPKLNILGCASVAVALQDMSWSSWGPQGADGTGTAVFKMCEPNCALGSQVTDPVTVHAWNPRPPRNDSGCPIGLDVFADMILAFPKGIPPGDAQKITTQYNGMPAVHYENYSADAHGDAEFIGFTWCS
jgi:hypothetical protein